MTAARPIITVLCPRAEAAAQDPAQLQRPEGLESIEGLAEVRYTDAAGLGSALEGAQALFLWDFFSPAVQQAWPQADSLEWIHVAAAGVDALMFEELRRSEVTVTNAQGIFDRPIAEYVLAAIFAHAKDFAASLRHQQQRQWVHRETLRVQGTSALIIGTGAIGRETARLLRAVGIEVTGAGRTAREQDPDFGTVVESADLPSHIGGFDHIINAAPLTAQTIGLISEQSLAAVRRGAHLINIGRGESVDETALVQALQDGRLARATLDVFEKEPLPADSPLWAMESVTISAHMSGDVLGWRPALAEQFVENARRWLDGAELKNIVDTAKGYVPRH
ncbi:D-2-hydroxyacid dehydrogenase [Nesterenkonia sp. E16_7]|uniref:D-2-hydroxyacid dehydrogenase n=1 Tax=unclassified Nesterenkonia TaxID=2629769 RepID=UPI001A923B1D|nr:MULTISPECIES: D-2-hydroxyacid dehydrogenase [unclassified Nesterenkonia]MBO0596888.1 D-2-hydroxyacid dehydrogenase [Nesterenkonia sp. E16_10]MBO0598158.1 D-2-hydroxyacid dehydrogenase [Nesterenkonia sp. E16_7]